VTSRPYDSWLDVPADERGPPDRATGWVLNIFNSVWRDVVFFTRCEAGRDYPRRAHRSFVMDGFKVTIAVEAVDGADP